MYTKKDYWIQILIAYVFLAIGLVIISQFLGKAYSLFAFPFLGLAMVWIFKAVKIFRSLKDKNVYPKKFIFLNRWAQWSLASKRFKYVFLISIFIGGIIGFLIACQLYPTLF